MHIISTKPALLQTLALLKRAIQEPTDLPILSHVLLQVENGRASLAATNLKIALRCDLVATAVADGGVTVPWRRLADLVEHLPPECASAARQAEATPIELEAPENSSVLAVRSGRSRATIYGFYASEFPALPGPDLDPAGDGLSLTVASGQLASMFHKVAFAASTDGKPDPVLTGILLYASGQSLTLTARDAGRLAACTAGLGAAASRACTVILPAGVAGECEHVLASAQAGTPARLVVEERRALLSFLLPGIVLSTRLEAGTYPMSFQHHVRPNYLTRVVVETARLASTLRPLARIAGAGDGLVTLTSARTGESTGALTISAGSRGLGGQAEEVDAASLEGEPAVQLLLKYSHLAQAVAVIDAPYLALEQRGQVDPVAVRPVGGDQSMQEAHVLVPFVRKQSVRDMHG